MEMRCSPAVLSGKIAAIPSKADAHRLLICSALSGGETVISCPLVSKDIEATVRCLNALGADITLKDGKIFVKPVKETRKASLDCGESGSTLRFLLPVVSALGVTAEIYGGGRLPERPIDALVSEMKKNGAVFGGEKLPLTLSGKLKAGKYTLKGNISSQFVSGLLFALPLLEGDSKIELIKPVESRPYIDMTAGALKKFGIRVNIDDNIISVPGGQKYVSPGEASVEGDWSNSAFFLCAGALSPKGVTVSGLDADSPQGDKKILDILKRMGALVSVNGDEVTVRKDRLIGLTVDASDIPDTVPAVSALAAMCETGATHIVNASRLRIKECDRLSAVNKMLTAAGAAVSETDDGLVIWGQNELTGGRAEGCNDHRIVMAAALLSCGCSLPVDITTAEASAKSYPSFFEDFNTLGGKANVINDGK